MVEPRPVLLVGNGPSRISQSGISWEALLAELRRQAGATAVGHDAKPFALHFEELRTRYHLLHADRSWADNDREYRSIAARLVRDLQPNDIHRAIMSLPVRTVLTTNYDYCLERAAGEAGDGQTDNWNIRESRYSLFLRRKAGLQHVFHIHGEARRPATIMLGQQEYVDSCARIRKYATVFGEGLPCPGRKPVTAHFRQGRGIFRRDEPHSWVDLFMLRDVHIVGMELDLSEVDLWYLISYKARLTHLPDVPDRLKASRIWYHEFGCEEDALKQQRRQMLASFGVQCVLHPRPASSCPNEWEAAWAGVIDHLRTCLKPGAASPRVA